MAGTRIPCIYYIRLQTQRACVAWALGLALPSVYTHAMKNSTLVAGGIGILILAAGVSAYVYSTKTRAQPQAVKNEPSGAGVVGFTQDNTDPFDVSIQLTNDGFSPRDITITQGTRVRFTNASDGDFWPASGIHPTHTLYPEKQQDDCLGSSFDACDALKPGQFYDYTFYYVGKWPYHDHLHGFYSGAITVVNATSSDQ